MSPQSAVWLQVAEWVAEHPNGVGRSEVAKRFGVHKSVAKDHLEKAVDRGLLEKSYTWVARNYRGWVYTVKQDVDAHYQDKIVWDKDRFPSPTTRFTRVISETPISSDDDLPF